VATTLEGRDFVVLVVAAGAEVFAALGRVAGCERTRVVLFSLRNSPCPGGHVKYRSPRTDPSFLPVGVGMSKMVEA
jgi:hypothetical protein